MQPALQAVRRGFDKIEAFSKHFDPKTELMLPGNARTILNQTAKELGKLAEDTGENRAGEETEGVRDPLIERTAR